ncbi:NB-ARC domain containing protein [Parasponia andersonii]|uniref:NB-ARC domain containing protein n=1 Tax=Parasponia andersonii TaxID=3476 RepID=A0A2P5DLT0_PARAD|nr:NB-ARC domain containing protein [Parasponia andersonii]
MAYDMAGNIVDNLRRVADQSSGTLQRKIINELRKLTDEISSIRQVLVDAEKKQVRDDKVRDWLSEVEDVLHDVDNLVDELHFHVSGRRSTKMIREVRKFFSSSCSNQLVFCRKISYKIKKYMKELHRLGETRRLLDLQERPEEAAFNGLWNSNPPPLRENIYIGREKEKEKILHLLVSDDDQESIPVLPIVGVAGLGKTTLAQLVCNDEMVRNHFDLRMWVHVSEYLDFYLILNKVIQSANDSTDHTSPEDLRNVVNNIEKVMMYFDEEISTKRFLLVLDDMSMKENCKEDWEDFKRYLTAAAKRGSRIIVTTRDPVVARMTGTMETCELSGLNEDLSWSLFESFFPVDVQQMLSNVQISEVGKKIVNKCGGNPFVIQAICGMLLFRDPETRWHLMEKDLSDILEDGKDILSTTVELSCDDLPSNLKKCFGYCSLFPKDNEIDVQTLIKLWTSEGFIKLEEEGYECFLNLLWRSFFEESKRDEEEDKVTKCKMQNLWHDHAKSLFRNRCITFGSDFEGVIDVKRTRHVSFDLHLDSLWQIPSSLTEAKGIRTVILPSQLQWETDGRSDESICGVMISKFKRLRTLDLHNSGIKVVPDSISELKFLRYLDLSQNKDIKALPKCFTKLQYLQTLKLNNCGRLRELPDDMDKLNKLRNLEINSCYSLTHMPRGLGKLPNLQILSDFVLTVRPKHNVKTAGGLDELSTLNNLRGKLRVKNLGPGEGNRSAKLSEKQFLRSLVLFWDMDNEFTAADYKSSLEDLQPHSNLKDLSISAYHGTVFPGWLPCHTNLVKFVLWGCRGCSHLPLLSHLPALRVLVLEEMASLDHISDATLETSPAPIFFPSLKELRFTNLPILQGWWRIGELDRVKESARFPCLSKLIIEDCPRLTDSMPLFPHLTDLLVLKNTHWEPFQRTISAGQVLTSISKASTSSSSPNSTSSSSSSSSSSSPLSELRTLRIVNITTDSDADDMFQSLASLCSLAGLRSLTLDHLEFIENVLQGFQHVTGLQELHIWRCDRLMEIPTWIYDLKSIQNISVRLCPNLSIPPDRISSITSIKKLEIEDCPRISYVENLLKDRNFRR